MQLVKGQFVTMTRVFKRTSMLPSPLQLSTLKDSTFFRNSLRTSSRRLEREWSEWFWRPIWRVMFQIWPLLKVWSSRDKSRMESTLKKSSIENQQPRSSIRSNSFSRSVYTQLMYQPKLVPSKSRMSGLIFFLMNSSSKEISKNIKICQYLSYVIEKQLLSALHNLDL